MKKLWFLLVIITVLTAGAQAQIIENSFELNPVAATLINPAFQHSEQTLTVSFGLIAEADSNSWNPALISRYGNKNLEKADKDVILEATHANQFSIGLDAQPYLGVKYEQFGFRIAGQVKGGAQVPSEVLHLALKGNEFNKGYQLDDINGEAAGYLEAAATFATPINQLIPESDLPEITLAISAKYLHGLAFGQFTGEAEIETKLVEGEAKAIGTGKGDFVYSQSGSGFAVDLGISAPISDKLIVDASILNLGAITWRNVEYGNATMDIDVDLSDLDQAKFDYAFNDATLGDNKSWKIPRTFRIGAAYQALDQLTVLADLSINKSEATGLTSRQVVGIEYRPWDFMPIQAAIVKKTRSAFRIDLGWGLDLSNFKLGISIANAPGLLFPKSQGTGVRIHTSIVF